ncbi:MAG: response regulator [Rhodospirillaceae bacterium]
MTRRSLKVLVVEDVSMFRTLIRHQLAEIGITQVATTGDGAEALDLLLNEPDFDLILCDWHLEEMDGLEFCARVQATPYLGGRRIPVLFMTGDERLAEDAGKRQRALETARDLGIVDILIKPFTANDIRAVLERCGLL